MTVASNRKTKVFFVVYGHRTHRKYLGYGPGNVLLIVSLYISVYMGWICPCTMRSWIPTLQSNFVVTYLYIFLISWFAENSKDSVNNGHENVSQERTNLMLGGHNTLH